MTTWPTNQLAVRQAISAAIDRTAIGAQGEDGQEFAVKSASGLTTPLFSPWAGTGSAPSVNVSADPATAESILTKAGYKKDSAGFYALNGKEVALKIEDPAAYTDYAQDDQIIVSELKAAGINATPNLTSTPAIWTNRPLERQLPAVHALGQRRHHAVQHVRQLAGSHAGQRGQHRWRLRPPEQPAGAGHAGEDRGRPAGTAQQATDFQPLLQYVAQNLPVIPTVNSAQWFEANSSHFTGWPSQDNPYESGQPSGSNNSPSTGTDEVVLLHLKPVS